MEAVGDEDGVPMSHDPPPARRSADSPLLVSRVDYCLTCGVIAVMYDLSGNIIKREPIENKGDLSDQELFDCYCTSLGLHESNNNLKDGWNLDAGGALPFCIQCEEELHKLGNLYQMLGQMQKSIKRKMVDAEDTFVKEKLYQNQHMRYWDFRKYALDEITKEDLSSKLRSKSQSNVKAGISFQRQAKKNAVTAPPAIAGTSKEVKTFNSKTNLGPQKSIPSVKESKADQQPYTSKMNSFNETKCPIDKSKESKENLSKSLMSSSSPENIGLERRRSLRIRDKAIKFLEEKRLGADAEVCIGNLNTCKTSQDVLIKDENQTFGENRVNLNCRGRKRKRQSEEAWDIKNDWTNLARLSKKRLEVRLPSMSGLKRKDYKATTDELHHMQKNNTRRKFDIKVDTSTLQETGMYDDIDVYLMAPLIEDPLSANNIYYRTVKFVWIEEDKAYQCSTCSFFISNKNESALKMKFHRHFILYHSDRFKCRLCPAGSNQFQSDQQLHQHFRIRHPKSWHLEPDLQSVTPLTYTRRRSSNNISEPKRHHKIRVQPCSICSKPINTNDEKAAEQHRLSHMNVEEKATYRKNKENVLSVRKRSRKSRIYGQFTTIPKQENTLFKNFKGVRRRRSRRDDNDDDPDDKEYVPLRNIQVTQADMNYCSVCGQLVGRGTRGMTRHMMTHEVPKANESQHQNPVLKKEQDDDIKPVIHKCRYPQCEQSYILLNELSRHVDQEHSASREAIENLLCKLCGKNCQTQARLEDHYRRLHNISSLEKIDSCRVCPDKVNYDSTTKNEEDFICPAGCDLNFLNKYDLNSHLRVVHNSSGLTQMLFSSEAENEISLNIGVEGINGSSRRIEISADELGSDMGFSLPPMQRPYNSFLFNNSDANNDIEQQFACFKRK